MAESTLKKVKKETKDVMGKQFKKLQKKIYKADEELFWDSILDFFKKRIYMLQKIQFYGREQKNQP